MAGAEPGIVGDQHVAGLQRLGREFLQQRLDRARQGQVEDRHGARRMSQAFAVGDPAGRRRNPALPTMISEKAVRQMVCHISSTTVTSRLHMISSDDRIGFDQRRRLVDRRAGGDARGRRRGHADGDAQAAGGIDGAAVAGRDDGGGLAFLDDGRAGDARIRRQRVTVVDRRVDEAVAEPGGARALSRRAGVRRAPASARDSVRQRADGSARATTSTCTPTPS